MTNIGEIVLDYNFFECPVCLELFDDTCKMLPCQHTFHKRCLQKILSVEERLECPQCRLVVSEDIELLPRNYFLLSVLDKAKPKQSESDQESLQLQFVIEKSKSEAEVKAREEFLLSQKEKLEYELMLLKSEKKGFVADDDLKSQNSSASSVCGYTSDGGGRENDCESSAHKGEAASLLVSEFGGISICDSSLESPKKNELPLYDSCCAMSLEQQVANNFRELNTSETHSDLVEKLLVIVRAVDAGKNFEGMDLMHLIDYDDLIQTYLNMLADQLKENSFTASNLPAAAPIPPVSVNPTCAPVYDLTAREYYVPPPPGGCAASAVTGQNLVSRTVESEDLSDGDDDTGAASAACALPATSPCLDHDYQSYTFDDDDRNFNYAIELSRQLAAGNEPDDLFEQVLSKSRITGTLDQQKQIFLSIREKVELQIALLMSKV